MNKRKKLLKRKMIFKYSREINIENDVGLWRKDLRECFKFENLYLFKNNLFS